MGGKTDIIFPTVKSTNLEGRQFVLPDDFDGKLNLVFIAFLREHQDLVDTWMPDAKSLVISYPGLCYYELPTIYKMNFLYKKMLNGAMKAGIPDIKAREATITLYLDKEEFRSALGIPDEETIHVLLLDKKGRILWRTEGACDEVKIKELKKTIEEALK